MKAILTNLEIYLDSSEAVRTLQALFHENDQDFTDRDVEIAVRDWMVSLAYSIIDDIEYWTVGPQSKNRFTENYLKHRCDLCECEALPGDIFCGPHRATEDKLIIEATSPLIELEY